MQQENSNKYLLKYAPIENLFLELEEDLKRYDQNGMIDRSTLIRTIMHCNANLGLKIQPDKETIINVDNYFGKLPADFYKFNFGVLCTGFKVTQPADFPKRELKEIETLDPTLQCRVDPCQVKSICGKSFVTTETRKFETIEVTTYDLVSLKNTSRSLCADECLNFGLSCDNEMSIRGDQVDTNFKKGSLYFSYTGLMESEEGELLYLDHELIFPYYLSALKFKVFDILHDAGEQVEGLLAKHEARYKYNKVVAESIVATPEYEQVAKIFKRNRERFYNTYYKMIY